MVGGVGQKISGHTPREQRRTPAIALRQDDFVEQNDLGIFCVGFRPFALANEFVET